mgnify:CR=1 FL=1
MKKRFLSLLLVISVLAALITALPITASAASNGTCGDNLIWTLDDNSTLTISGTGDMQDYSGGTAPWYWAGADIKTVLMEDGVTSIGIYAFTSFDSLTSVTIPDSVTSIGNNAFASCNSLKNVTIPNSITRIGNNAFASCDSLTSVTIPDSVTKIGYDTFYDCDSLTRIDVDTNNNTYASVDGVLFNKLKTKLICCPAGKAGAYIIPDSAIRIGDSAFASCDSLTSVTIPRSVISIGDEAFVSCNRLTSVTIPDSVTSIGDAAFYYCCRLTSVTIPNNVTSIGDKVFYNCNSLKNVTIPNSVISIGGYAFRYCGISVIYYSGTQSQWDSISIASGNEVLDSAEIEYQTITYDGKLKVKNLDVVSGNIKFDVGTENSDGIVYIGIYDNSNRLIGIHAYPDMENISVQFENKGDYINVMWWDDATLQPLAKNIQITI